MIDERWRRLPFTSTSVWSGARFRSIAGRTTVDASLIGCVLTANEGITVRSCSGRLTTPWLVMSAAERTSTGTGEAATVRGRARVPTTTVSSVNPSSRTCSSSGDSPSARISSTDMSRAWLSASYSSSVRSSWTNAVAGRTGVSKMMSALTASVTINDARDIGISVPLRASRAVRLVDATFAAGRIKADRAPPSRLGC